MDPSLLTADNLNANKVLVAIQIVAIEKRPRRHVSADSFTTMRDGKVLNIYEVIDKTRDYFVAQWSDQEYSIHLRPLLSEQEWLQFKRDILVIYTEQNSKRAALRQLVQFNLYRPLHQLLPTLFGYHLPCCRYPYINWSQRFFSYCTIFALLPLLPVLMLFLLMLLFIVCLLLDLLTLPRFFLFHRCHVSFLESVMEAHPDLDPALVEEELILKMQQLAQNMSAQHPGVHCRFSSSLVHQKRSGSTASYDEDVIKIQFHKFAPESPPEVDLEPEPLLCRTVDNSNANQVLLAIQNRPRTHISVAYSFATIRSDEVSNFYKIIDSSRDYSVARWGDKEYSIHLRPLLSEQEWLQFKRDILIIYAEQNSKRAALRQLIEFHWYRPLIELSPYVLCHLLSRLPRCGDPLVDMHWSQRYLRNCIFFVPEFAIILMWILFHVVCLLLDLLTLPRFILFHDRHVSFLESVMEAHPDLDPALVEIELNQKMQQLAQNMTTHHPGVYCRFSSSLVHYEGSENDVVEIQFNKFALAESPSQRTVDNLNANKVLVTIQNKPRRHVWVDSFATIRSGEVSDIYEIIDKTRDYSVARWGDMEYSIHLRPLLSEQEWLQFKRDILIIYAEQNSKRAALRKLVQFNWYRPLIVFFLLEFKYGPSNLFPELLMRREIHGWQKLLLSCVSSLVNGAFILSFVIALLLYSIACVLLRILDLLIIPRLYLCYRRHVSFLESVIVAHPDLDPALVEEELIQRMQQLAQNMSAQHPGVHCRFSSTVVYFWGFKWDFVEIQFHKFAPDLRQIQHSNTNKVLLTIQNRPKTHVLADSFRTMRDGKVLNIYAVIDSSRDYFVARWGDMEYSIHLRPLLSEQEWLQFKRDILSIYAEQNSKRAALRQLVQFNLYRPLIVLFISAWGYLNHIPCCWYPPRDRDMHWSQLLLLNYILFIPRLAFVLVIWLPLLSVCLLLDLLTLPRFFLFHECCHVTFLESVMVAHPELDPALVEEEFVQKMQQLAQNMSAQHPGVHCRFISLSIEVTEIQFHKFAPELPPELEP